MGVVLRNLAINLSYYGLRIIFFGRFGQKRGFSKELAMHEDAMKYELVNCQGGVWKPRLTVDAINHYEITHVLTEDDFFSIGGLVKATRHTKKPLHFITPIDSLPIHPRAHDIFKRCEKVYVPNSSYKLIKNGHFLPHGVNFETFFQEQTDRDDIFTFLWVGRDEPRKALGRFIMAFEKTLKKVKCQAIIHSDWRAEQAKRTARYIRYKRDLPIILKQMESGPQSMLRPIYNSADAIVCTSKAGAFEMSITEGMACGLYPIVTDWTFMNEIFNDKETGFKIPISSECGDTAMLWHGKRWGVPLGRKWGNIDVDKLAKHMIWCAKNHNLLEMNRDVAVGIARTYDWMKIAGKLAEEIVYED